MRTMLIAAAALLVAGQAQAQYNGDGWRAQRPATAVVSYKETRHVLRDVQYSVNQQIRPMSDEEQYGGRDMWVADPPSGAGDCDDYAMTKRSHLMERGVPAEAMQIKKARVLRTGEMHAVLAVETDEGEVILDNLVGTVTRRKDWDGWTGVIIDNPSQVSVSGK